MLTTRLGQSHDWPHDYLMLTRLCRDWDRELVERLCRGLLQSLVEHPSRGAEAMAQLVGAVLRDRWPPSLPGGLLLDAWQSLAGEAPKLAEDLLPILAKDRVDL